VRAVPRFLVLRILWLYDGSWQPHHTIPQDGHVGSPSIGKEHRNRYM
jgi:hypothetical protein